MTFGAEIWGPAALNAAGSVLGGVLSKPGKQKETKIQKQQRHLVDQLLASLKGRGPYSGLFSADNDTFQKSYVEPAKALFRNQIAPQIQQEYIATGQHRSTGLDDQLLRAGVDLDQMLNTAMAQQRENALGRQQQTISSIFGVSPGPTPGMSTGDALKQSAAGYLSSPAFSDAVSGFFRQPQAKNSFPQSPVGQSPVPTRKGYLPDWNLGDPRWGQS